MVENFKKVRFPTTGHKHIFVFSIHLSVISDEGYSQFGYCAAVSNTGVPRLVLHLISGLTYFYILYIMRITINNNIPHLKSPKEPKTKCRLRTDRNTITGGLQLVCGRPNLAFSSALVSQTLSCLVCVEDS